MSDCKDELDERDCRVVEFPAQKQYKETLPPVGRKADGEITPAKVCMSMETEHCTNCGHRLELGWMLSP